MNKICIGCGQIMQNLDEDKPGYTPNLKSVYCRRCFRLKNYGERKDKEEIDEEKIFAKVNKSKGIAFFLVDFLNINQKTTSLFNKIKYISTSLVALFTNPLSLRSITILSIPSPKPTAGT